MTSQRELLTQQPAALRSGLTYHFDGKYNYLEIKLKFHQKFDINQIKGVKNPHLEATLVKKIGKSSQV